MVSSKIFRALIFCVEKERTRRGECGILYEYAEGPDLEVDLGPGLHPVRGADSRNQGKRVKKARTVCTVRAFLICAMWFVQGRFA